MIELWMLLRAVTLLKNMSNVRYILFLEEEGILYEVTDRLIKRAVVTKAMRFSLWEVVSLRSFVGYRSTDGYILIVQSPSLTQETLESIMFTISQQTANYKKEELLNELRN